MSDSPIRFQCPHCPTRLKVASTRAGDTVACPNPDCRQRIQVPMPLDDEDEEEAAPRPRRKHREQVEETDDTDPTERSGKKRVLVLGLVGGLVLLLAVGGGIYFLTRSNKVEADTNAPVRTDPSQRYTRSEVESALRDSGFEISKFGAQETAKLATGEVLYSGFEVECTHKASKATVRLQSGTRTSPDSKEKTQELSVSAERSPATEAAFKARRGATTPDVRLRIRGGTDRRRGPVRRFDSHPRVERQDHV